MTPRRHLRRAAHRGRRRLHARPGADRRARSTAGQKVDVDRHQQGQGHRRCHEASRLQGPRRRPRHPAQAPLARLHRRLRDPGSRVQGPADGRPHGRRQRRRPRTSRSTRSTPSAGLLLIKGAVPGPKGGLVLVRTAAKRAAKGGPAVTTHRRAHPGRGDRRHGRAARRGLRRPGQRLADAPGRRGPAGRGPPGHARHQDARRGQRRWRKPYRQKGTGRARQGSTRAPQFDRRWHRPRPDAARLRPADAEEDEGRRPARRPCRTGRATAGCTC